MFIFLLILFIRDERKLVKQGHLIETLNKNNKTLKNELNIVKKTCPIEKRNSYRINLSKIESTFSLMDFGNDSLGKLKNRNFNGVIEDLSIGGLKFLTSFEFPVKYNIIIKINFTFYGEVFDLKGKIMRREDHIKGKSISYGVQFVDLTVKDITRLNLAINNYQVENRDKIG
jgi:hypothetical protein